MKVVHVFALERREAKSRSVIKTHGVMSTCPKGSIVVIKRKKWMEKQ